MLTGAQPALRDASIRLEDGRRVRITELKLEPGEITLTCRTQAVTK
jgi:hypothetical protein